MEGAPISQVSTKELLKNMEGLDKQIKIFSFLEENGLIDETTKVEDPILKYITIEAPRLMTEYPHITENVAVALTYLDSKVKEAQAMNVSANDIAVAIPGDIISSLITDPTLKQNDEFIKTVRAKTWQLFSSGGLLSDAVLGAVEKRQAEIHQGVTGVIDETTGIVYTSNPKTDTSLQ